MPDSLGRWLRGFKSASLRPAFLALLGLWVDGGHSEEEQRKKGRTCLEPFSALFHPRFNARNILGEREGERSIMHPLPLSLSRSLPSVPSSLTFYSIVSFVDHSSIFMYLRSCRREYKMADPSPLLFFFFFLSRSLHDSVVFSSYPLSITLPLFPPQLNSLFLFISTDLLCSLPNSASCQSTQPPTLTTKIPHSVPTYSSLIQDLCTYTLAPQQQPNTLQPYLSPILLAPRHHDTLIRHVLPPPRGEHDLVLHLVRLLRLSLGSL